MIRQNEAAAPGRVGRRVGYAVAVAVNVALLVIVNSVLDGPGSVGHGGSRPGAAFHQRVSAPSIAANAIYLVYDGPWFKGPAELGLLVISLVSTVRLWQVFPFDFSAYDFAWDAAALALGPGPVRDLRCAGRADGPTGPEGKGRRCKALSAWATKRRRTA